MKRGKNRGGGRDGWKKLLSIALTVALITSSIPPREVEASWFSDLMGGIFTVITSPILLVAKDNPTLRKNSPFRKKIWEEEAEKEKEQEMIRRCCHQPAPQTIVIEKAVEVVKDNSPEINALKGKVAALETIVAETKRLSKGETEATGATCPA
jgi:hypothetical protein